MYFPLKVLRRNLLSPHWLKPQRLAEIVDEYLSNVGVNSHVTYNSRSVDVPPWVVESAWCHTTSAEKDEQRMSRLHGTILVRPSRCIVCISVCSRWSTTKWCRPTSYMTHVENDRPRATAAEAVQTLMWQTREQERRCQHTVYGVILCLRLLRLAPQCLKQRQTLRQFKHQWFHRFLY